ncbi:hypothetical protein IQ247_09250 [Plectonema cf. radiosum LEGE 06105]|uniref:ATPase dynein-related AAA domain-containing protein n=1 Tax=Plectonema cf. radiosum LEGE 06105 TaxID=945769 RepID=A0A8J7K2B6_9CYAN|nr:hypothetical protein [Plectonema radiosum]MBE9212877.1 hypothetical protein [Plectonema cf. radiosum LEGE 06105]
MSNSKNRHKSGNLPSEPKSSVSSSSAKAVSAGDKLSEEQINTLEEQAKEQITEEQISSANTSTPTNDFKLEDCWKQAKMFETAIGNIQAKEEQIETKIKELDEDKLQLELKKEEINKRNKELIEIREKLNQRAAELSQLERQLRERELNAEAGFIKQNRTALAELENQSKELSHVREQLYQDIAETRKKLDIEIAQKRTFIGKEIAEKEQEIETARMRIDNQRKQLRLEQRKLETERELLEEDKQALSDKVEQKSAAEKEELKYQIERLKERLKLAQQLQNESEIELNRRQEADRRFGQKTPDEILEELENLRREKAALEQKLASKLSDTAAARLQELESQLEVWETERFRLSTRLQELQRSVTSNRIAVTELETLRDEKEALDARNTRLKIALDELKKEVDEAVSDSKNKSPFPECFRMDADARLQREIPLYEHIPNLEQFAEDLRSRIALSPTMLDKNTQKRLYYSKRDVRAFLAGLAMSQLHILQGISGTGKTSLPVAFARATGGDYKLVEVQAGWRDRQDLIGYFNAFEGKFYESDFLQALYEAQCPSNRERIYIIILDEMNLSRPEQYFADFLSKLEQDSPTIGLTTDLDKPSPQLFQNQNRLAIPPNVWFVGTANQDETTLEFADKTYDRSHIMELQRRHDASFNLPKQLEARNPISHQALIKSFNRAQTKYASEASQVYKFLNDTFADFLERRFKVGWGNRLERQIKDFVPVVIAAGGTKGEACDQILATKILRKIRDRHDTPSSDLRKLKDDLLGYWSMIDSQTQPEQSVAIIDAEIRRLEPGEEY